MSNSEQNEEVQEETLIKAGLRKGYFTLVEGVYDPGILKAVFLAGGPGSGKSAIAKELFNMPPEAKTMSNLGLKVINSDQEFEHLLKKAGYSLNLAKMPDDLFDFVTSDDPNSIRSKAKDLMQKRFEAYKDGRLGVIIDGTGDDYKKILGQKEEMQKLGYDCYMVYVNTTLDVAQERNAARERKLKRKIVKDIWIDVQKNLGDFQKLFGKMNLHIIDNSEDTRSKKRPGRLDVAPDATKATARFIGKPIKNPLGKKWIKLKMGSDVASKSGDKLNRMNEDLDMDTMEGVILPMDLERHLTRSIFVIKKFKLNEKRNLAVLTRLVESLNLNRNQINKYFHQLRTLKFRGEK
jgi:predicted kinase